MISLHTLWRDKTSSCHTYPILSLIANVHDNARYYASSIALQLTVKMVLNGWWAFKGKCQTIQTRGTVNVTITVEEDSCQCQLKVTFDKGKRKK